jgi:hypothetical protein
MLWAPSTEARGSFSETELSIIRKNPPAQKLRRAEVGPDRALRKGPVDLFSEGPACRGGQGNSPEGHEMRDLVASWLNKKSSKVLARGQVAGWRSSPDRIIKKQPKGCCCGPTRARTWDPLIMSQFYIVFI